MATVSVLLVVAAAATGCDLFGETRVTGRVFDGGETGDLQPIPGARVGLYGVDAQRLGFDITDDDGTFTVHDLPPNVPVLTVVDALPDFVPTSFSGSLTQGDIEVADGSLFALSATDVSSFIGSYGYLAAGQVVDLDNDGNGGCLRGSVFQVVDDALTSPIPNVSLTVYTATAQYAGVYLNDSGAPDDSIEATSGVGQFAAFNLPEGVATARLVFPGSDGSAYFLDIPVLIVEDGVTLLDGILVGS